MRKIKIAQIGVAHNHGAEKMRAVRKFPDIFEVMGYSESDPEWRRLRGGLEAYHGLPCMAVEELLAIPGLEAVLVETEVKDLVPTAQICVEAGLHIHLDKPAGESLPPYEKMLVTATAKGVLVQLGYMYRYNPAVQYCYRAVKNGFLGDIFSIEAVMNTQHPPDFRRWLGNFRGGAMYIFGCHLIDLIITLRGVPERIIPWIKQTEFDNIHVNDNCFAVLEYGNGLATVRTSSVEVNGFGRRQLVVCGSRGTIEIKPLEKPVTMSLAMADQAETYQDCKRQVSLPQQRGRYDEMMVDFARIIRGERENPFPFEHELRVHRAILQACDLLFQSKANEEKGSR